VIFDFTIPELLSKKSKRKLLGVMLFTFRKNTENYPLILFESLLHEKITLKMKTSNFLAVNKLYSPISSSKAQE